MSGSAPTQPSERRVFRFPILEACSCHLARIHGTSWLTLDKAEAQDPYNLFSLFRTHASLASTSAASQHNLLHRPHGLSTSSPDAAAVPAPLRMIFARVPTFSSPHIPPGEGEDEKAHPPPRERAQTGLHPLLPKTVLPALGMWFEEDWADLADMHVPFVLERVVLADRGAAERGREQWAAAATSASAGAAAGAPAWAAPFAGLHAPVGWWAPVRAALLRYLGLPPDSAARSGAEAHGFWGKKDVGKAVVTFVSMRDAPTGAGARLAPGDEDRLVEGLRRLEREGVLGGVHVVSGNGSVTDPGLGWEARRRAEAAVWTERMEAFARSTVSGVVKSMLKSTC